MMDTFRWAPNVTVAAVVEDSGRFLVVEEETPDGLRLNNPAGHLEPGESLLQAVCREALEEAARVFEPQAVLGVYLARVPSPGRAAAGRPGGRPADDVVTYLRIAFRGRVGEVIAGRTLDTGIVRTLWLTPEELRAQASRHRTPLLMRCVDDHRAGRAYPLALIATDLGELVGRPPPG